MTTFMRRLRAAMAGCMLAALTACGGGDPAVGTPPADAPPTGEGGVVQGQVLASRDASPIAGATVSVGGRSASTDAEGRFRVESVAAGAQVVKIEAAEYADGIVPVTVDAQRTVLARARLVRESAASAVDPQAAVMVRVPGSSASMQLQADSLVVAATGAAPTGQVSATLTPIDPAADPQSMPGSFVTASGTAIESFGAMRIELQDSAGNRLALRSGRTAVVRIPLASRNAAPPETMPLFYLDEATGRWVEQGSATLMSEGGVQFFEGTIDRMAVWNIDKPVETIAVKGCVRDAAGQPAVAALVTTNGLDYSGAGIAASDPEGRFAVAMRRGGRATLGAESSAAASAAIILGPAAADVEHTACLVLDQAVSAPTIIEQPANAVTWSGMPAVFRVVASGQRLSYQWKRNGVDIPGATYAWLVVPRATEEQEGRYSVVVSNPAGTVTSGEATLAVLADEPDARRRHLNLLSVFSEFVSVASAPYAVVGEDDRFVDPATICSSGTVSGALNGAAVPVGQEMPLAGVISIRFDDCVDAMGEFHDGAASLEYAMDASYSQGRSTFTADALRLRSDDAAGTPYDFLANGSSTSTWSEVASGNGVTQTFAMTWASGTTLREEITGSSTTFHGGSVSLVFSGPNANLITEWAVKHETLNFSVDGVAYLSAGVLEFRSASTGLPYVSGEVVLWMNGRRVGRLYASDGNLFTEVDGVAAPLHARLSSPEVFR